MPLMERVSCLHRWWYPIPVADEACRSFDLVGHSMGGMLAVRYAVAYPAATERLVLVNAIGLEDYAALIPLRKVDDWFRQELEQTP